MDPYQESIRNLDDEDLTVEDLYADLPKADEFEFTDFSFDEVTSESGESSAFGSEDIDTVTGSSSSDESEEPSVADDTFIDAEHHNLVVKEISRRVKEYLGETYANTLEGKLKASNLQIDPIIFASQFEDRTQFPTLLKDADITARVILDDKRRAPSPTSDELTQAANHAYRVVSAISAAGPSCKDYFKDKYPSLLKIYEDAEQDELITDEG